MRWLDVDWHVEAIDWIEVHVPEPPAGPIEQVHIYPWSTVMRVPTSDGDLWFKANSPVHRFEAELTVELARFCPERVVEVVAADPDRGWLLMRDAGTRLRDHAGGAEQLAHWERVLPRYAELQLALAPRAGKLLELGVPDERLEGLPARFASLLDDREALLLGAPEGVTEAERERLRAAVPEVAALSEQLAAVGIAETLQHDDLHDGQVFVANGGYRVLDWGDACVSHPFHTLVVTLRATAYKLGLLPGGPELERLRDAYLEPFADSGSRAELVAAVDLAQRTGTIARALAWHRYVSSREPDARDEDAEAVPYGLKRFLAGGPIGSWDSG